MSPNNRVKDLYLLILDDKIVSVGLERSLFGRFPWPCLETTQGKWFVSNWVYDLLIRYRI